MLKKIFGTPEQQKKATYGSGKELTLKCKIDNSVLIEENAINTGKIEISAFDWCVPQYTPSISNQVILSNQILSKTSTELQYVEISDFKEEVNTQKLWTFELGTQERLNVPLWIIVGFQQRDGQDSQKRNNDTFHRPALTFAQCTIGTEKYLDSGILLT